MLFRLANLHGGLVVGTGDLSELALGWCTYGVGDQMSHYAVNASVPKTLIQYLVQWVSEHEDLGRATVGALDDVLATGVSPELVPASGIQSEEPTQLSEDVIGPYELQDFFLYHVLRFGYRPTKVAYLAHAAWRDRTVGAWPAARARRRPATSTTCPPSADGCACPPPLLRHQPVQAVGPARRPEGGIRVVRRRRGWAIRRAPSDASAALWLAELDALERELATPG